MTGVQTCALPIWRRRPRSGGWNGEVEIWARPEELFPAEILVEGVVDLKNASVAIAEAAEVGGRKIEWAGGGAWVGDAKDEVVFVGELDGGGADGELLAGGGEDEKQGGFADEARAVGGQVIAGEGGDLRGGVDEFKRGGLRHGDDEFEAVGVKRDGVKSFEGVVSASG